MLRFSKKIDHALLALQDLASERASGLISVRAIAPRVDSLLELLAKISPSRATPWRNDDSDH
jgi:DNA-binding IscR family transcriptional regulator